MSPEIEIPDLPLVESLTCLRLAKNLEEIGQYLEKVLPGFQDLRFSFDAAWAPEFPELTIPKINLTVYTETEWCQMALKTARVLDPKEVHAWFLQGKEPRFGDRGKTKGKFVEGKASSSEKKAPLNITLDDLDL